MIQELSFDAGRSGKVSARLLRPESAEALYLFAHGAGAGMDHRFMEGMAVALAERGVATLRYQFPYMERGRKRPDGAAVLEETVRSAVIAAVMAAPDLPLVAGGKSMGGRITSQAQAREPLPGVRGIVFLGFPLHAPGREDTGRSAHLNDVEIPMLFVQGTRDRLARMELMSPVVDRLPLGTMEVIDDGDHSFKVPKRAGRTEDEVLGEIAEVVTSWCRSRAMDG